MRKAWLGLMLGSLGMGCEPTDEEDSDNPNPGEPCTVADAKVVYKVSDANLETCYDNNGDEITCPSSGEDFYGQDANYDTLAPAYTSLCGGEVVQDDNTGLQWEAAHHDPRVAYETADSYCEALSLAGREDWRIPTIKELISISDWNGSQNVDDSFYLDSTVFDFDYPDLSGDDLTGTHSNQMMGQTWSSTSRPDTENLNGDTKYFYNFLDAHIKSNSATNPDAEMFYRCVRGDGTLESYLSDNGDGTVTDEASGRMWQKANGEGSSGDYQFTWRGALAYCEELSLAEHDDWRLPDVKELHSIVDYAPNDWAATKMVLDTSTFDFNLPAGTDLNTPPTTSPPNGTSVAPFFWSSTSHGDSLSFASYVCFGPCWAVEDQGFGSDVHGPGAQRSDPKDDQGGNLFAGLDSIGDQLDVVQVDNFVRCVR
jgi:hypothetical protein